MVTYKLVRDSKLELIFEYYPEGRDSQKPGIIAYNKVTKQINIETLAEGDYIEKVSLEELLESRRSMDEIMMEERKAPLTEDEWPIPTQGFEIASYGHMAIKDINKKIEAGNIPKKGIVAWY